MCVNLANWQTVNWSELATFTNSRTRPIRQNAIRMIPEEDDRIAEAELGEVGADRVDVADDQRGQARGIEMAGHHARHLVARHRLDRRHELREVVVGQVVERELHRARAPI